MTPEEAAVEVEQLIRTERFDEAWRMLEPFLSHAKSSSKVAWALVDLQKKHPGPPSVGVTLREMLESSDEWLIYHASECLLAPIDGRHTDDPYGDDDPSLAVIPAMQRAVAILESAGKRDQNLGWFWYLLANACRHAGPEYDGDAERAYRAAIAIEDRSGWRFDLGLLYKNRGRWSEGVELYQRLLDEGDASEAVLWNLGICATGAKMGQTACDAWTKAGFAVTLGEDGLPRMEGLGAVKVRLSTGTLRERCARDYEHVWVQPVSPCHGQILNATLYDHGYDIGDLVMWDGQPIGRWRHGEREGNRFAALGKVADGGWRTFTFRGRQERAGQMKKISEALPNESSVYVFEEEIAMVCTECVRTGGPHTARHGDDRREASLVTGKLVVDPRTSLPDFVTALEAAVRTERGVVIASAELHAATGNTGEAARHEKLMGELSTLS